MTRPIVLIHIPKTAGTAFASVLRHNFPAGEVWLPNVFRDPHATERRAREVASMAKVELVRGHAPLTIRELLPPGWRYVSFLREPLARSYSHYRHVYNRRILAGDEPPPEQGLAESPLLPDNLQTRMLSGLSDWRTHPADDALLTAALRELRDLEYVGITERFAESMLLARDRLGLRSAAYRRENVRGAGVVPPEHVEALRRHNELDLQLYNEALALLGPRLAGVSAARASALERAAGRRISPVYTATKSVATIRRRTARWKQVRRWRRWRMTRALRKIAG